MPNERNPSREISAPSAIAQSELPRELLACANGELVGQQIVAWSEFDLDESNLYSRQFAVLTEERVILLRPSGRTQIPLPGIEEAKINEGLGVDRLRILAEGKLAGEARYSRRHRRSMTRLLRKLQRRISRLKGDEVPPEWLENIERQAEQKEICPKCGLNIPAYAEGVCPQCLQKRAILWRLLDVAKPYRKLTIPALIFTLMQSSLATLPPLFQGKLVDSALGKESMGFTQADRIYNLVYWTIAIILAVLVLEVVGGIRIRLLAVVGTRVARDLRHQVYAHMHELSLRYFAKRPTGSLITRVTSDTDRLWDFIVFGSVNMIRDFLMIAAIAIVMFVLNWRLALVAILPLPVLGTITYYRSRTMQRMFGRLWTYWARMTAVVGDAIPGVRVVKAFANERREVDRFDQRSDEYSIKEQEVNKVWTSLQPLISGTMRLGMVLV